MPTGYTAGILDGSISSFEEYAKLCVRNFGASIHMRDEPLNKPYEPRTISSYYNDRVEEKTKQLEDFKKKSYDEVREQIKESYNNSIEYYKKQIKEKTEQSKILNKFLEEAKSFIPPTDKHKEYKDFMIQQIETTLEFDCNLEYYESNLYKLEIDSKNISVEQYIADEVAAIKKDLVYYNEEKLKEIERVEHSNEWVKKIYEYFDGKTF